MTRLTSTSVLAALALAATAHAQPAPPTPASESPSADAKVEAKARYDKGLNHYNLGEFDDAIVDFKAAYALTSAPGLLFNIAQSYRLKKDYEQASYFYKTYLRLKPEAANRADVEQRIAEMDKTLEDQRAIGNSPPRGMLTPEGDASKGEPKTPVAKPVAAPPTLSVSRDNHDTGSDGHSMRTAGLTTAAVGGALVITGLIFGKMASSAASDLSALSPNMGTWTAAEQDRYDSGKRSNTIAIISFVAGGAAIAGGTVLYFIGRKHAHPSVAVVPTPTGAAFALAGSF